MTKAQQSKRSLTRIAIWLATTAGVAAAALAMRTAWVRQSDSLSKSLATTAAQPVPEKLRPFLTPINYSANIGTHFELEGTGSPWDLAIGGDGFFAVQLPSKMGGGIGYTRDGAMFRDLNGQLSIAIGDGLKLLPTVVVPMSACNLRISQDGVVQYDSTSGVVTAGHVRLVRFASPKKLQSMGDGVYCRTDFSGEPISCEPGSNDAGQLDQGFLEALPEMSKEAPPGPPTLQGALEETPGALNLAIQGEGFLRVKIEPTIADGLGYTRNGKLKLNDLGQLITGEGYLLQPPITLPAGAANIAIGMDGTVSYTSAHSKLLATSGQIQLAEFMTVRGLREVHPGIYAESPLSGPPVSCTPGDFGAGVLVQGYLVSDEYAIPRKICVPTDAEAKRLHAEFADLMTN